jgi:hypothetical protein
MISGMFSGTARLQLPQLSLMSEGKMHVHKLMFQGPGTKSYYSLCKSENLRTTTYKTWLS